MDNKKKKDTITEKQEQVLEVLKKSLGIISTACNKCNIARSTFYKWVDENKLFAERVKEINELALDLGETRLFELVDEKNITAIIFFLKNKGRSRGYDNEMLNTEKKEPQKIQIEILPSIPPEIK